MQNNLLIPLSPAIKPGYTTINQGKNGSLCVKYRRTNKEQIHGSAISDETWIHHYKLEAKWQSVG
jgi:hypothetical protein